MSISQYLEKYRTVRAASIWTSKLLQDASYIPVGVTLSLSLARIQENDAATRLLCLIAFLHPDEIPNALWTTNARFQDRVLRQKLTDDDAIHDALRVLAAYRFIRRSTACVSIHRLVQHIVRDHLAFQSPQFQGSGREVPPQNNTTPTGRSVLGRESD